MSTSFLSLLEQLGGAYAGPTRQEAGPYGVVGSGEGTLAAQLLQGLVPASLTRSGTQFVLSSPDARAAATDYGDLAEVAGAAVRRVGTGGTPQEIDVLVPGGPLSTYHFAQYVAHASGHGDDARSADAAITDLAARCAPHVTENNPARDLAWSLWGRTPLLLAAEGSEGLPHAWQQLLARVGKTLAVPLLGDPLPLATGAFEAQHEKGDAKVVLLLGEADDTLLLAREVLESRVDEVIHVPAPGGAQGHAAALVLWAFGAWVAAYLAERYGQAAADLPVLARAQAVLAGEEGAEDRLAAARDDLRAPSRRTAVDEDDYGSADLDDDEDEDDE